MSSLYLTTLTTGRALGEEEQREGNRHKIAEKG